MIEPWRVRPGSKRLGGGMKESEGQEFGVYFVADDGALQWFTASYRTLRALDPSCQIFVIPFSQRIAGVIGLLRSDPLACVWQDPEALKACDALALKLGATNTVAVGMFRKFACFHGPLQRFIYLDCDTVIRVKPGILDEKLTSLGGDLQFLQAEQLAEVFSGDLAQEWSSDRRKCFNAGVFASARLRLNLSALTQEAETAASLKSSFTNIEQSFFNYALRDEELRFLFADSATRWSFAATHRGMALDAPDDPPVLHWAGERVGPGMSLISLWFKARTRGEPPWRRVQLYVWVLRGRPWLQLHWHSLKKHPRARREAMLGPQS